MSFLPPLCDDSSFQLYIPRTWKYISSKWFLQISFLKALKYQFHQSGWAQNFPTKKKGFKTLALSIKAWPGSVDGRLNKQFER